MAKAYGVLPFVGQIPPTPTTVTLEFRTAYVMILSTPDDGNTSLWTFYLNGTPYTPVNVPTVTISGLTPNTDYVARVQASNPAGSSELSPEFTFTTSVNTAPLWDTLLDQTGTIGNQININLSDFCEDIDGQPLVYSISSGSVPGCSVVGNSFTGTLSTAGNYSITFDSYDGYAHSQASQDWVVSSTIDVTPPTIPQNYQVAVNGSTVTHTWNLSTDTESGVKTYRILRNGSFLTTSDSSPYVETGVPDGDYTGNVRAVDNANPSNVSDLSNTANYSVVTLPSAPDTPINFVATPFSTTRIDLSWAPGPNGAAPTDYDIDFNTIGPNGPWTSLPFTGTATTFSHTGLSNTNHYWYRIRANAGAVSSAGYATVDSQPIQGPANIKFIIPATMKTFNCAAAEDITGVTRKVLPGEVVQINDRTGTQTGVLLNIQNPQGTVAQPIRFVPPPNGRCTFKRTTASGQFVLQITGSTTNPNLHGNVVIDGETTSTNVPINATTGLRYGFRFQPANANEAPTAYVKLKGIVQNVTVRYVEYDGTSGVGGLAYATNDNELDRTTVPSNPLYGLFKGPYKMEYCKVYGGSGAYIGSNYDNADHGPGLPCKDVTVQYTYWEASEQTPILVKNCWGGNCEIHHNIVKNVNTAPNSPVVVQKRGIAVNGCAGSVHHNWIENVSAQDGGAQSPNHAIVAGTNKGPSDTGDPGYNGGQPYTMLMKIYSNVLFNGFQMGIASNDDAGTGHMRVEIFNNTIDDFGDYGIQITNSHSQSFARNNIVTRTRGVNIPGGDAARNTVSSSATGFYVNLAGKNYHLASARPVHGTSVLDTGSNHGDVASSDYDDTPITSVSGADMGAFQF